MVEVLHTWGRNLAYHLGTCTLPAEEFIRRFLQHVLPKGFVKVRYYGFPSSGCRQRLAALRQQLGRPPADPPPVPEGTDVDAQTADHVADDSAPDLTSCAVPLVVG